MNPSVGTAVSQRAALAFVSLAVACATGGCGERVAEVAAAPKAECSVIARFTTPANSALLADLERMNAVRLEPLSAITDELRVYRLRVVGADDDCSAALERLRQDERVRSIELDAQRELHQQPSNLWE
ncbi:MAG TPA: hypothetical protein VF405_04165 [Gammaproteobacteria bacterium]